MALQRQAATPSIFSNKDWGGGGNTGFVVSLNNADQPGEDLWKVNASDHSGHRLDWSASKNGATTLVDGSWHFVAVVFDRDATMNVYLDGDLKQTVADASSKDMTTIPGDLAPDDLPLTLMQDGTGHYSEDFEALLDDILVYDRVLTAEEVKNLNDNGYHVDPSLGATVYCRSMEILPTRVVTISTERTVVQRLQKFENGFRTWTSCKLS
ncbi:MAG: LamG-like jellyroll fold domain-containing protein [Bacteroidota bacterium]